MADAQVAEIDEMQILLVLLELIKRFADFIGSGCAAMILYTSPLLSYSENSYARPFEGGKRLVVAIGNHEVSEGIGG
jgi:hypothetical protein